MNGFLKRSLYLAARPFPAPSPIVVPAQKIPDVGKCHQHGRLELERSSFSIGGGGFASRRWSAAFEGRFTGKACCRRFGRAMWSRSQVARSKTSGPVRSCLRCVMTASSYIVSSLPVHQMVSCCAAIACLVPTLYSLPKRCWVDWRAAARLHPPCARGLAQSGPARWEFCFVIAAWRAVLL